MEELLARALEAHGGLERWSTIDGLRARLSLGGPFWAMHGWPDVYADQTVTLATRREHIEFAPFTAPGIRSILDLEPRRISIQTDGGEIVDERVDPDASYPPFESTVAWDAIQVAYFTSAAVWNYLTTPFLLSYPGVEAREGEAWSEEGETWRRLDVVFPDSIATHNRDQSFYFDEDFLLRRLDYQPLVTQTPIAHYAYEHKDFDGLTFPTKRAVHLRNADNSANKDLAFITIAVDSVEVVWT